MFPGSDTRSLVKNVPSSNALNFNSFLTVELFFLPITFIRIIFFSFFVFENVAFGLTTNPMVPDGQTIKKEVNKALQAVGLLEDLDGNLTRPGTSLSLEQQQRLCIARCLPTRPKILLMDEPCSALDPSDTDKVEELIRELKKDYTVVIVTHNLQQAGRISDQSVLFHLGKIIEAAPTADFFQNPKEKRTRDFITGRYG